MVKIETAPNLKLQATPPPTADDHNRMHAY